MPNGGLHGENSKHYEQWSKPDYPGWFETRGPISEREALFRIATAYRGILFSTCNADDPHAHCDRVIDAVAVSLHQAGVPINKHELDLWRSAKESS